MVRLPLSKFKPPKFEEFLLMKIASRISDIAEWALKQLPLLIVDENGNVRWREVFDYMVEHGIESDDPAVIAAVIDQFVDKIPVTDLDMVIEALPAHKKLMINGLIGSARTALSLKPDWIKELKEKREKLIVKLFFHPSLNGSRPIEILRNCPNLMNFIARYIIYKLDIDKMAELVTEWQTPKETDQEEKEEEEWEEEEEELDDLDLLLEDDEDEEEKEL